MAPLHLGYRKRRVQEPVECFIAKLPDGLLTEIFLRLSVATLMRCRRVCKGWRSLISSPGFNRLRLQRRPSNVFLCSSRQNFLFLEGEELDLVAVSTHEKGSVLATRCSVLHLVNSCNGLICVTRCLGTRNRGYPCSSGARRCHGNTIFVVNPVTSEYVALPSCPEGMKMELCALGFCSKTNQFKAVRVLSKTMEFFFYPCPNGDSCNHFDEKSDARGEESDRELNADGDNVEENSKADYPDSDESEELSCLVEDKLYVAEVCILGTGTWRRIEINLDFFKEVFLGCGEFFSFTYVNGSVYWMTDFEWDRSLISSFDFESERFLHVTPPHSYSEVLGLGAFREDSLYLCLYVDVDSDDECDGGVKLLQFKKCWIEETIVEIPKAFDLDVYVDKVVKCFENGSILFWRLSSNGNNICLLDNEKEITLFPGCDVRSPEDVIVHVPSFLSLKDLVEGPSLKVWNVGSKNRCDQ